MRKIFKGVCTALVTPFSGGAIDFVALERLLATQSDMDALLVLGTTGESASLTFKERAELINFVSSATSSCCIVGVGGNNLDEVLRLLRQAKELGADAVLVTPPYYVRGTQAGIVKWFREIGRVGLPIIVYNIPGRAGVNILPQTLAQICKNKMVVGIKESSGSIQQIAEVIRLCPKTPVYCGDDALSLPSYALGAQGLISVASNARPLETLAIWRTKNAKIRAKLFLEQLPFYRELFEEVNPVPIKRILSQMGIIKNEVRLPLTTA